MFKKLLIANRGEIALRIHRACKEMGIKTVAIHSTADADAMHVRLADEAVCVGPASSKDSYLNVHAILSAAIITGAEAIHPGYGFLSENAKFAEMVEEHGITFVGPSSKHIKAMGDKITAKQVVEKAGIPVVPGSAGSVDSVDDAKKIAKEFGLPVLIKATAGGGGRGMQVVREMSELEELYKRARQEAGSYFSNDTVYIEKFLDDPRHIEIQVIADKHGNVCHLGERDCSLQRRNQKVLEESPSPVINQEVRDEIGMIVANAIKDIGYSSVGTVEFLYENGQFFFIEMNTRLQVEHPVTELVYNIDLVQEMIKIAYGDKLSITQDQIKPQGHAIEFRINAEDPETFMPSPGTILLHHAPGGYGVRVDSALYTGYSIPPYYDSMISKVIIFGKSRDICIKRAKSALSEYVIDGVKTSIPLHTRLLEDPTVLTGDYTIKWLEADFLANK